MTTAGGCITPSYPERWDFPVFAARRAAGGIKSRWLVARMADALVSSSRFALLDADQPSYIQETEVSSPPGFGAQPDRGPGLEISAA